MITIIDDKGEPHVAAVLFRCGISDLCVDNFLSGGGAAIVEPKTGIIISLLQDHHDKKFIYHPKSNVKILGMQIDNWQDYVGFALELAKVYPAMRYAGWDIVKDSQGKMVCIEGNAGAGVLGHEGLMPLGTKALFDAFVKFDKGVNFLEYY